MTGLRQTSNKTKDWTKSSQKKSSDENAKYIHMTYKRLWHIWKRDGWTEHLRKTHGSTSSCKK